MMKNATKVLAVSLAVLAFSCGKDDDSSSPVSPGNTTPQLVNNGAAGVNQITDTTDTDLLLVAQAVPSQPGVYPANMPIMFFLDDKVYLPSVMDNFKVTENGTNVVGKISVNEAANGFAILTFTPHTPFGEGKMIEATLKMQMLDDGGNGFMEDFKIAYTTGGNGSGPAMGPFDTNGSFESDTAGVSFIGDGAILSTSGDMLPQHQNYFAAITTGNQLVSGGSAVGGESSMMLLGPINSNLSSLSFHYDFASAEFNEYVGSIFDDVAMVTVTGPNGSYSTFLTSVNTVANANTQCNNCAGLPDNGDSYAGHTGWTAKTINFAAVGSPAYVVFTVTDVSDQIYSSVLAVDNITY